MSFPAVAFSTLSLRSLTSCYGEAIHPPCACACRSGDGYWLPVAATPTPDANDPIDVRVYCADGSPPKTERGLVPATMLCPYQTPGCKMHIGTVQC